MTKRGVGWGFGLRKERPVRLRAYQAGLWGCLTNPGRVGGLVGSAYDFRITCSSSYQTWNTRNPAARNWASFRSGAFLTGRARGAFFDLSPNLHILGRRGGHRMWPFRFPLAACHLAWAAEPTGFRNYCKSWTRKRSVSSWSHIHDTPLYRSVKGIGPTDAFLLQIC